MLVWRRLGGYSTPEADPGPSGVGLRIEGLGFTGLGFGVWDNFRSFALRVYLTRKLGTIMAQNTHT